MKETVTRELCECISSHIICTIVYIPGALSRARFHRHQHHHGNHSHLHHGHYYHHQHHHSQLGILIEVPNFYIHDEEHWEKERERERKRKYVLRIIGDQSFGECSTQGRTHPNQKAREKKARDFGVSRVLETFLGVREELKPVSGSFSYSRTRPRRYLAV